MTERGQMMDDAWYMDYAAGSLESVGEEVLIASHLELSGTAGERVAELERIGAALLMVAGDESSLSFSADDIFEMRETFKTMIAVRNYLQGMSITFGSEKRCCE